MNMKPLYYIITVINVGEREAEGNVAKFEHQSKFTKTFDI